MKDGIKRASEAPELETIERCFISEIANDVDDPDLSIALARVAPGVTTAWHLLRDTAERYLILAGEGMAEVADWRNTVAAGDVVRIPPDTRQRITNTGAQDLLFYAICTPRFEQANYVDLEAAGE